LGNPERSKFKIVNECYAWQLHQWERELLQQQCYSPSCRQVTKLDFISDLLHLKSIHGSGVFGHMECGFPEADVVNL